MSDIFLNKDWEKHIGNPEKVFYCAFFSIKKNNERETCFRNLLQYLEQIQSLKKKEDWVFNQIFKTKWNEKETKNVAIANVSAAKETLQRLIKQNPGIDNLAIIELLVDLICDIRVWMNKVDPKQDFTWLISNTNKADSRFYYTVFHSLMFEKKKLSRLNSDARFVSATLLIRHTIEHRIKGLLGIDYIINNNRPIGLSSIIENVGKLSMLKYRNGIDFNRISKINDWANHFLHRGIRPYPWLIEWANTELEKWFYKGITLDEKFLSVHASFETEDLGLLRAEFEEKIKIKFPTCIIKWHNDFEIHVCQRRKKID
jgi:hypothetical protein